MRIYTVYINQRDAQILVNSLYFVVKWLYMFRTIIIPSSGATFVRLVGLYTHCNMMHGAYNVKRIYTVSIYLLYTIQKYLFSAASNLNALYLSFFVSVKDIR